VTVTDRNRQHLSHSTHTAAEFGSLIEIGAVWCSFRSSELGMAVKLLLLIGFMVVNGFTSVHAQARQEAPGVVLIVHDARIFTGNSAQLEASALAVKCGRIYSVGTDVEVLALRNANIRVIDSRGRRHIPGIIDAHTHVRNEGGYKLHLAMGLHANAASGFGNAE
jgi:hypothetical protein